MRSATSLALAVSSTTGAHATSRSRSTAADAQNSELPSIAKRALAPVNSVRIRPTNVANPASASAWAGTRRGKASVAAADANPYVILAAALGSGLWGIEHRVEPEAMVTGNAYDRKFPSRLALPRTLWESAQRLKASRAARELSQRTGAAVAFYANGERVAAEHPARDARAQEDHVLSHRPPEDEVVEGRHRVQLGLGHPQVLGHVPQRRVPIPLHHQVAADR